MISRLSLGLALLLAAVAGGRGAQPAATLTIDGAWARATVAGQSGSGAYMRLTSREDAQLVGASTPVADRVEIHEMHLVKDMMSMRRIEHLALPAGHTVVLGHDFHLMLIGLKQRLTVGQRLTLTLDLLDAQGQHHPVSTVLPVRPLDTPLPAAPVTPVKPVAPVVPVAPAATSNSASYG